MRGVKKYRTVIVGPLVVDLTVSCIMIITIHKLDTFNVMCSVILAFL